MNLNAAIDAFRRSAACLLLAAFVCAQLLELTHLGKHSELDQAERCAICIQLDKPGSAAVPAAAPATFYFAAHALPIPRRHVVPQTSPSRPSARAPPVA